VSAREGTEGVGARRRRGRPSTRSIRRERILEAATRLIHVKGYQRTTIQDVADESELSKAAFYYFVKNKEDLLYQLLLRTLNEALHTIMAVVHGPGEADEKLLRVIDSFVRMVAERPDTFAIYFRERSHLSPEHLESMLALEREIVAQLKRIYAAGVASGRLRELPEEAVIFALLGACFWTHGWFRPGGRLTSADLSAALQALLGKGMIAQP
jgi:AcrR family transcriptional regulator